MCSICMYAQGPVYRFRFSVTPPFPEVQPVNLLAKIKMYVSFTVEQFIALFEAQSEPKIKSLQYSFPNRNSLSYIKSIYDSSAKNIYSVTEKPEYVLKP